MQPHPNPYPNPTWTLTKYGWGWAVLPFLSHFSHLSLVSSLTLSQISPLFQNRQRLSNLTFVYSNFTNITILSLVVIKTNMLLRVLVPRKELHPVWANGNGGWRRTELHILSCVPALLDTTKNLHSQTLFYILTFLSSNPQPCKKL